MTTYYLAQGLGAIGRQRTAYRGASLEWLEVPKDTGCEIAPRCLECPLEKCLLDYPQGLRSEVKRRFLAEQTSKG
jgi:hypothetical protein